MRYMNYSDDISKLATVPQAIERYKVSRKTLMKYANDASAVVRFGRSVRIDIEKMDVSLSSQSTGKTMIDGIKEQMCDNYCKYPNEIKDDEELYDICGECPLGRLG